MNLAELKAIIDDLVAREREGSCEPVGDLRVVVETANGGCPTRHMAGVDGAAPGFDWTQGLFIVRTSETLVVERRIDKPLRAFARERLDALKAAHEQLRFKYIAKAREEEWIDGFIEGAKSHITALDAEPTAVRENGREP